MSMATEAWHGRSQFMLYPCVYAMAAAVSSDKCACVNTLIDLGTDVNRELDIHIIDGFDLFFLYSENPPMTHLEVALEYKLRLYY